MTTLSLLDAIERPSILGPDPGASRDRDAPDGASVGGVPTLDEVLTGTWDAVVAGAPATCLVCDGPLEPRYAAGPAPVGARCRRCGSELS
jgi:hypothetical protein